MFTELKINNLLEIAFCPEHGEFENIGIKAGGRVIWAGCKDCTAENIKKENENLSRYALADSKRRELAAAALPPRYRDKSLDAYQVEHDGHENALNICAAFADNWKENFNDGAGLLFYGNSGTGKTHLAAGIALEVLTAGGSVLYTRAAKVAREIKGTWARGAKVSEAEIYEKYLRPDLLIIDEIGMQYGSESEKIILFEIINSRYENLKPVIAITNLTGERLRDCIGAPSLDRLKEKGVSVCFDWPSMRARI